ncbi:hypothetical protein ACIRQQ_46765 [Streptomyces fuscichromogenes]|uniref:hypothetical protein n=1 Tax=Streptomyces fuscichromogenes TaxID=1324013 RepID=UPI003803914A
MTNHAIVHAVPRPPVSDPLTITAASSSDTIRTPGHPSAAGSGWPTGLDGD